MTKAKSLPLTVRKLHQRQVGEFRHVDRHPGFDCSNIRRAGNRQSPPKVVEHPQDVELGDGWLPASSKFRMYYGPAYISESIINWAKKKGIRREYIQPGKPQQNAYVERFNRTVRYEWLAQYCFDVISEVQDVATRWTWNYNHERPNMALGGITPKQRLAMAA